MCVQSQLYQNVFLYRNIERDFKYILFVFIKISFLFCSLCLFQIRNIILIINIYDLWNSSCNKLIDFIP